MNKIIIFVTIIFALTIVACKNRQQNIEIQNTDSVVINSELITEATSEYNKTLEENPELKKVLKKYTKTPAQLFVFQHVW